MEMAQAFSFSSPVSLKPLNVTLLPHLCETRPPCNRLTGPETGGGARYRRPAGPENGRSADDKPPARSFGRRWSSSEPPSVSIYLCITRAVLARFAARARTRIWQCLVGSGIGFVSVIQPKIRSAANGFAALRFGSNEPIWNLSRMSPREFSNPSI